MNAVSAGTPAPAQAVSPQELIARAEALEPLLREEQDSAEERGYYSEKVHEEFVAAGFYDLLTPKKYGGLEVDLTTFAKIMIAIGRGDPASAWCLALGAGHAYTLAAYWPEQAQEEIFNNPMGYYRSPHRFTPMGTATPVEGGYIINGRWDYCSGIQYASHFKAGARVVNEDGSEEEVVIVLPHGTYEIQDDWGGDATLGMRASGSNSVIVKDQFTPAHHVVPMDWRPGKREEAAPGAALHNNPMYRGRIRLFYMLELTTPVVGAAKAAVDEFERIISTKLTLSQPRIPRYQDQNFQRDFGWAMNLADSAERLLIGATQEWTERSLAWQEGEEFSHEDEERLRLVATRAGFLACEAVELAWQAASTSSGKRGERMQRYFRDVSMYRQHNGTQFLNAATQLSRMHFGLPANHGSGG